MKISVCMATYNGEKYIKEQLESILSQLEEDDEVIISDDGSTDETLEIVSSLDDERICIYKNVKGASPIYNFENALEKAVGDFIFLSDQDDVWCDGKVSIMLGYLRDFDLVVSDAFVVDENLNVISNSFFSYNGSRKGVVKNLLKNSYSGCAMAFNRRVLRKSLPFPAGLPMHDWWVGLMAEKHGSVYFAPEPLILHRRHGSNASATGGSSPYGFFKKVSFRLKVLWFFLSR